MNTTTKRFSRSLADAFPDERWHCVEITPRHWLREVPVYACFLAFVALVLWGFSAFVNFIGG